MVENVINLPTKRPVSPVVVPVIVYNVTKGGRRSKQQGSV